MIFYDYTLYIVQFLSYSKIILKVSMKINYI